MQSGQSIQEITRQIDFGRYHRLKRVGRGGMGEVWLCEDSLIHRQVAIKTLPPHNQQDQDYAVRFEREAQAAAALNHPHILPVHDYGKQALPGGDVMTYLVMPYVNGGSLADTIKNLASKRQGMEQERALLLLTQAADAIDHAHAQGIVHRDIKPANMLLHADNWLLLSDFGVVRIVSNSDELTEKGMIIGTPMYMAPEQALGHAEAASDTYSLAVIAYQLVVGHPPFNAETSYATLMQHMLNPPPAPRLFHPDLPAACEEVLLRGLAKQPAERYPTARTFVDELKRSLGVAIAEDVQDALQPAPQMSTTRRNVLIGAGAGVIALATGASFWAVAASKNSHSASAKPRPETPAMVLRDHLTPAEILTWMPNKNLLTSASDGDYTVKLWDIDSFRYRQQPEYESTQSIKIQGTNFHMAWSPDARYLALANSHSDSDYNTSFVDIYSLTPNNNTLPTSFMQSFKLPVLSVDGLTWMQNKYPTAIWSLVSMDTGYYLGMFDLSQTAQQPQPLLMSEQLSSSSLNFKGQSCPMPPDGRRLAIATLQGVLVGSPQIMNNKVTWQANASVPLTKGKENGIFGSPILLEWGSGGKRLICIYDSIPFNIMLGWDLAGKPNEPLRFGIPPEAPDFTALATHPKPTNNMFAAGTENGTIYLWSGETKKMPIRTLAAPDITDTVLALSWSPDGQWLAASYKDNDATILIWKI
ncbi:MAG TPA: WD40 repeat domain-containing serine/threonine-protein kinase [Ktedonobacteraceae bacterium]